MLLCLSIIVCISFRRLDTDLKLQQAAGLKYGSGGAGAHARVGCSSAAGWHQRRPHSCRELPLAALFSRLTSGLFGFPNSKKFTRAQSLGVFESQSVDCTGNEITSNCGLSIALIGTFFC